jgi:hypothetical protein
MSAAAVAADPGSKYYWGPRLWRLFHLLAEVSDRRDITMLWRNFLRTSAAIVPCMKCRTHFQDYVSRHRFGDTSSTLPGKEVRALFRDQLRIFHNEVNQRLKKPIVSKEEYAVLYSPRRPRLETIAEVESLFAALNSAWKSVLHTVILPHQLMAWKHAGAVLIAMVKGGPTA